MPAYTARRLLPMVPTLLGILSLNFVIVQFAPGGPVQQIAAQVRGTTDLGTSQFTGSDMRSAGGGVAREGYRGARERFLKMIAD